MVLTCVVSIDCKIKGVSAAVNPNLIAYCTDA
jgi:hypothetical protein